MKILLTAPFMLLCCGIALAGPLQEGIAAANRGEYAKALRTAVDATRH